MDPRIYNHMNVELQRMGDPRLASPQSEVPRDPDLEELPPHPAWTGAKLIAANTAGTALGALGGYGAGALARDVSKHFSPTGTPMHMSPYLQMALPVLGAASSLAFQTWQNDMIPELSRDHQIRKDILARRQDKRRQALYDQRLKEQHDREDP